MDDLTSKNNRRNMATVGSAGSSISELGSHSSQRTTATSVRGSARREPHSCAVHLTPVEAIDPAFRLSNMGASFADYHRKFGVHHGTDLSMDEDESGNASNKVNQGQGHHIRVMEKIIMAVSILIIILSLPFSLILCFRVVRHYERLIVLRMGRIRKHNPIGPGTIFVIPCIDSCRKIDLRIRSFDIKSTDIMLADSVQVRVEAVVWYRVICPLSAVVATDDYSKSTEKLTIGMIRRFLGYKSLTDVVSHEREFNQEVNENINQVWMFTLLPCVLHLISAT